MLDAQPDMFIKNIQVSKIKVEINRNKFYEDERDGPYLKGILCFQNNSIDTVTLLLSESKLTAKFNYNKQTYITNIISTLYSDDKDSLILYPDEIEEVIFYTDIFYGTSLLKSVPYGYTDSYLLDYTKELIKVLPTFRIIYRDLNCKIQTNQILSIEIMDW